MRRALLALGLAIAVAVAPAPAWSQNTVNFRDADIRAFIEDAARVTGRTFIVDAAVQGRVSVVTQRPLSRSEYFELFLSTLRANGLIAVPLAGGGFRIQPVAGAAASGGRIGTRGGANSFVTEILRTRSIEGTAALETLRPLVSKEGSITATRNSIVVADFADNVRRIRQVLASIDRDNSTQRVVPLRNAGAREIAQSLNALMEGAGGEGGRAVVVVPIDSSNSIALRGDAATVARLAAMAEELDERAANGTEIRVIFLQHADAAQLLPVLQQLLGQPVTQPPPTPGLSRSQEMRGSTTRMGGGQPAIRTTTTNLPDVSTAVEVGAMGVSIFGPRGAVVTRFQGANALVIAASADVQRQLGEVIRQLDTRRQQVLVEAIIVEISDNAAKRLGVQLLLAGLGGSNIPFAVTNYSNANPNILTLAGAAAAEKLRRTTTTVNGQVVTTNQSSPVADALQEAAVNSVLGATGGIAGLAVRAGDAILGAIVNAVKSDSKSNILSTPSIMTLDNQEARILVGQEIPITTGEALSPNFDNQFRTVDRENVGITLEVLPQINAGGSIKLNLRQEVSSIAGPVSGKSADLILNKREIETVITVDDGEIVGIGGLLDDNERRTLEKIPFLGDLPAIGNLFRSKSRSRAKTNLMVFIRPTILRSTEDARAMTERRYGYIRGMQYQQNPDEEPSLDELVREYMGMAPPGPPPAPPPPLDPASYAPVAKPGDQVVTPAGATPK
ncbi:MAG TPA: type II secretion system secretin GspD [Allosphingosinicella sp.]|nr:type II secretion system secretin GspD [Allosphingosinicella sp.]